MSNLSLVWQEYLRTAKYHRNTCYNGHIIEYGCGIQVDLSTLQQDIKITEARKVIQKDYNRQRARGDYQMRNKFFARERQTRVNSYTVKQMQGLHGSNYIEAFNRIISGRAALAGPG